MSLEKPSNSLPFDLILEIKMLFSLMVSMGKSLNSVLTGSHRRKRTDGGILFSLAVSMGKSLSSV